MSNIDDRLITENREKLKSITIQICDEKGNVVKPIIISDQEYMDLIYNHLRSIKTDVNNSDQKPDASLRLALTYAYAYDNQSGKQDVIYWGTDNTFYRHGDNGYVFGENEELHIMLTDLFDNLELEMVSEKQNKLKSITICKYEGNNVKSTISIADIEMINTVYSQLELIDTSVNLYPGHITSLQIDIEYELVLEYENKEEVVFTGTEAGGCFYRYTGTLTSSKEEGYVYGKNAELYKFIVTLF